MAWAAQVYLLGLFKRYSLDEQLQIPSLCMIMHY
jgi:hypothetical protein